MVSLLTLDTILKNDNLIGISDGCESVGNDQNGKLADLFSIFFDSGLDLGFIGVVKSRGGFVKNQDFGLLEEGSSYGESLFLTTRHLSSRGTDSGVDTFLKSIDEGLALSELEGLLDLPVLSIRLGELHVVSNSVVEENGFLTNVTDILSQGSEVPAVDGLTIESYFAVDWVVEPHNELDDGTLTGA